MVEGVRKRSEFERCEATGKVSIPTKSEAQNIMSALKNPQRKYSSEGKRVNRRMGKPAYCRVYHCHHCNGFHITSKPLNEVPKKYSKWQ